MEKTVVDNPVSTPSTSIPSATVTTCDQPMGLTAGRPQRLRQTPAYLTQDHQFLLPPSLLSNSAPNLSLQPTNAPKPPSECSNRSQQSNGTRNSARSLSRSEIKRRLAENESQKRLHELRRVADEEKLRIRKEATQAEENIQLEHIHVQRRSAEARLMAEHREMQVEDSYRDAELELEKQYLTQQLEEVDSQSELLLDLPVQEPIETVNSRTAAWVNEPTNNTFISSSRVHSNVSVFNRVSDCVPNHVPIYTSAVFSTMPLCSSANPVSMYGNGHVMYNSPYICNTGFSPTAVSTPGISPVLQPNQGGKSSKSPGGNPGGSDGRDPPNDGSAHSPISVDKLPQQTVRENVPYQYRYGMFVDSLPKLEVPKFDDEHNVKQYVVFRSLWDSIMNKAEFQLPEATKFAYLRSNLGGRPLAMADRNMILGEKAYATTMKQFDKAFGEPGRVVQGLLTQTENRPPLAANDWAGLRDFSDELVTLVETTKHLKVDAELENHKYATELALKLPEKLHTEFLSKMWKRNMGQTYNVENLKEWLEDKTGPAGLILRERAQKKPGRKDRPQPDHKVQTRKKTELAPTKTYTAHTRQPVNQPSVAKVSTAVSPTDKVPFIPKKTDERITCLFCNINETGHYLETCEKFTTLNREEKIKWLEKSNRCRKCAKKHDKDCIFPKKCKDCGEDHRTSLHEVVKMQPQNQGTVLCSGVGPKTSVDYDRDVLIKVVPLTLYGPSERLDTYGVLDECAERTMILPQAVRELHLSGLDETVRIETVVGDADWKGKCVDFSVSARGDPDQRFQIKCAFTADEFQLADYSLSAEKLQAKWPHLRGLPLFTAHKVQPAVLIGADHIELTLSSEVRTGPKTSSPVAVKTHFGWTVQGRQGLQHPSKLATQQQVLFTRCQQPEHDLHRMMERFMAIDKLPHINEKEATRSRLDKLAIKTLEEGTTRVEVQGVRRLQTPLLWKPGCMPPRGSPRAVETLARAHKRKMERDSKLAEFCNTYIQKLKRQGHVQELGTVAEVQDSGCPGWFIPYHVVFSSNKYRMVFNCSFESMGQNLNNVLLAGPTLNPSLVEVLLRFRLGRVAVSGDITAMFHQVRLAPDDSPMFRFLWWDDERDVWLVFQWLVLPFGATCSPCCATFSLQKAAGDAKAEHPSVQKTIERETYVDNQMASRHSEEEAMELVKSTRQCLHEAGFEMVKYASSHPKVVENLPVEVRSDRHMRSLSLDNLGCELEPALGLSWDCKSDELCHPAKVPEDRLLTKRTALRVLASQFEPLGSIAPFTARAKMMVQELWMERLDWDEVVTNADIKQRWDDWCSELEHIPTIRMQRCYTPPEVDSASVQRSLHVFCDSSERLYGAVAYLRSVDTHGKVYLSFVLARCRVAPQRRTSMPRLELMAALVGAQISQFITQTLDVDIEYVTMWSDSTTVLTWIQSDSCRFKIFVGTRIAEIQTLTAGSEWRYVRSADNPADDVTRGLSVSELGPGSRWSEGPTWLLGEPDTWQSESASILAQTRTTSSAELSEMKATNYCGIITTNPVDELDFSTHHSWSDLVNGLSEELFPADDRVNSVLTAEQTREVENQLLRRAQLNNFRDDISTLEKGQELSRGSRILQLAPELDSTSGLLRVGGRLRKAAQAETLDLQPHPILLDPHHPVTKFLIQEADAHFGHQAGTEQVFAYLRRRFWIIRGRTAVKGVLRTCPECRRWRGKPQVPRMADLPKSRLQIQKPPFYSTGMDCFGPFQVKIGRRQEKRWGLIFKCMTTRAVHLELVESLDTDHFLMAYRRFASRRGTPHELLSDCGTNFKGAESEIRQALTEMEPALVERLAQYRVNFKFNPPNAPHFGGLWEREVRSVKTALRGVLENRTVPEVVLRTVLTEVEGILNSKPLGYASSEIADVDPVTPNMLLMGRRDPALPMVVYDESVFKGRRSWRHSQVIADQFWRQFVRSYLPTLQARQKWNREVDNLSVGDVVLIADPQLTRSQWPVGKVEELVPGSDGRIRVVEVKVGNKTYRRPVARLVQLSKFDDDEAAPAQTRMLLTQAPVSFRLYGHSF